MINDIVQMYSFSGIRYTWDMFQFLVMYTSVLNETINFRTCITVSSMKYAYVIFLNQLCNFYLTELESDMILST